MDIVEINKLRCKNRLHEAEDKLYELGELTKDQALTLIVQACCKHYGLRKTVKIVHGLGVKNL